MSAGGYRPGSGRRSSVPGEKRVQMVVTVAPSTRRKLREIADSELPKPVSVGRVLDRLVDSEYDLLTQEPPEE